MNLPLAHEFVYGDFDADDELHDLVNKVLLCVRQFPRQRLLGFMFMGQLRKVLQQPISVIYRSWYTVRVDDSIVPGGYDFTVLVFAGIPRRGNVGLGTLEYDDGVAGSRKGFPRWVGSGHMAD